MLMNMPLLGEEEFLKKLYDTPQFLENKLGWIPNVDKSVYDLFSDVLSKHGDVMWVWKNTIGFFPKGFPDDLIEFIMEIDRERERRNASIYLVNGWLIQKEYQGELPAIYEDFIAFKLLERDEKSMKVEAKKVPWWFEVEELKEVVEEFSLEEVLIVVGHRGFVAHGKIKIRERGEFNWYIGTTLMFHRWTSDEKPEEVAHRVAFDFKKFNSFDPWTRVMMRPKYDIFYDDFCKEFLEKEIDDFDFLVGRLMFIDNFLLGHEYIWCFDFNFPRFLSYLSPVYIYPWWKEREELGTTMCKHTVAPLLFRDHLGMKILRTIHANLLNASMAVDSYQYYMMKKIMCVGEIRALRLAKLFSFV